MTTYILHLADGSKMELKSVGYTVVDDELLTFCKEKNKGFATFSSGTWRFVIEKVEEVQE